MQANPFSYLNAIRNNQCFSPKEQIQISYQGWDSFDRLLSGIGDIEDLHAMDSCARVLRFVCKKRKDVTDVCNAAIKAAKRGLDRDKAGLDGQGIQDCRTVLRLFDEALSGVSIGLLMKGLKQAKKERAKYAANEVVA